MIPYNEVKISRILNPTSIGLGEYVINPYMGCEYACLYCYVRSNRVVSRKTAPWGSFVDIRLNAPLQLEKELLSKKPKCVLLGSTTDCFQSAEKQYHLTKKILQILNKNKIYYSILTRSPFVTEYISLLGEGFCKSIYFTFNAMDKELKKALEPKSPPFEERVIAVNTLDKSGVRVIPYFSPIIPWISDYRKAFSYFPLINTVEFECLNFRLLNIDDIIKSVISLRPKLAQNYRKLTEESDFYDTFWAGVKNDIKSEAAMCKKDYTVYIHPFGGYFTNKYGNV